MSDFMDRARAEAARPSAAQREQVGLMVHEQQRYIEGFGDGVRWAAEQEPSDAEEEAGASGLHEYECCGREGTGPFCTGIDVFRSPALAVLKAVRSERLGGDDDE